MLVGEIKNAEGFVLYRIKGDDEMVRRSLERKSKQAKRNGLFTTLKAVTPTVKETENTESEAIRKDRELTKWALDWGIWDFGPFNPDR